MGKLVLKDFKAVVTRNRGLFKDYAKLVPHAARHFIERAKDIPINMGIEVSIYEPPTNPNQLEGIFYVGILVNSEIVNLPDGMEYKHILQHYAVIKGKITEIANLYSRIDQWIVEQGYKRDTPEHYIIEVYYPVKNDQEEVEVYIPIKNE